VYRIAATADEAAGLESKTHQFKGTEQSYVFADPAGQTLIRFEAKRKRGKTAIYATPQDPSVRVNGRRAVEQRIQGRIRFETRAGDVTYFNS
jgi:hypothetical protein